MQPLVGLDVITISILVLLFVFFTLLYPINFLGTISLVRTTIVGIILTVGSCATLIGQETAYSLTATHIAVRYTALTLAITFGCVLFTTHWIVLGNIFILAWTVWCKPKAK